MFGFIYSFCILVVAIIDVGLADKQTVVGLTVFTFAGIQFSSFMIKKLYILSML